MDQEKATITISGEDAETVFKMVDMMLRNIDYYGRRIDKDAFNKRFTKKMGQEPTPIILKLEK